jgi:hypothetical protein
LSPSIASRSFDFQSVLENCRWVLDLNWLNEGTLSEAELRARHSNDGERLKLIRLGGPEFTYLLNEVDPHSVTTVVLPGSTNPTNIELSLMTELVVDDELGVRLHEGSRATALSVRADLAQRLAPHQELKLLGYSMGGASAVILAAYLELDGHVVKEVMTFGQPKVTDADGAERLKHLPLLRVVSGDDPIVLLPRGQYAHCGDALILLDGAVVVRLPYGAADSLVTGLAVLLNDSTFHDHLKYMERITSKIGVDLVEVQLLKRGCYLN